MQFGVNVMGSTAVFMWAGIALSLEPLATGWTVRGSNPGGGRDFPHPSQNEPGAHPASYIMGTGSYVGVKRAGGLR